MAGLQTTIGCGIVSKPRNLNQSVRYFQHKWPRNDLDTFKNKPERIAVCELHFSVGMWIRNTWIHGNRDKPLIRYFHSLGVYHPESISSIILTSLHRTLNHRNVDLEAQVAKDKAAWQPIIDCESEQRKKAIDDYNRFKIGDSITIFMPVDTSGGSRYAVLYGCPTTKWTFESAKDLKIEGMVDRKYTINGPTNVFFTVRINQLNQLNIPILGQSVKTGDKIDFSLRGLTIK